MNVNRTKTSELSAHTAVRSKWFFYISKSHQPLKHSSTERQIIIYCSITGTFFKYLTKQVVLIYRKISVTFGNHFVCKDMSLKGFTHNSSKHGRSLNLTISSIHV